MTSVNRTIVLIGLMGAGKSRVGAELSRLLKMPFVDSDKEIERSAGLPIPEIFEKFGEAAFREGERKVILRLLSQSPVVLASGGGAFIQPEIRSAIKEKAISVWLKADLATLVERTARSAGKRPLLRDVDPEQKLKELMDIRYPVYAEADITVHTDHQTPRQMAKTICRQIDAYTEKTG